MAQYYILNNLYVNLSIKYVVLHKMVGFFRIFLKIHMMIPLFSVTLPDPPIGVLSAFYKYWLNSIFSLFGPSIIKNLTPFSQKGRK